MYIQTTSIRLKRKVSKATELRVRATDDISVAQLVVELAKNVSAPAYDSVSSQLRFSKRSNNGRR